MIPEYVRLVEEAREARRQIASLARLGEPRGRFLGQAPEENASLERLLDSAELGAVLDIEHLTSIERRARRVQRDLGETVTKLGARRAELEAVRAAWQGREDFWAAWRERLEAAGEVPSEVAQAREQIAGVLAAAVGAESAVQRLQEDAASALRDNLAIRERAADLLTRGRRELLRPESPWLLSPVFFRELRLVSDARAAAVASGVDRGFLERYGWLLALQTGLVLAVAWVARRARLLVAGGEHWRAVLAHPWAIAIFVTTAGAEFLYSPAPALWHLLLRFLVAGSVSVLATALFRRRSRRVLTWVLALLYVALFALEVFHVARPAQRLLLAALAAAGIPLLLRLAAGERRSLGRRDGFVLGLELGVAALAVTLLVELAGFHALAYRLLQAAIRTAFTLIVLALLVRLASGAIRLAVNLARDGAATLARPLGVALAGSLGRALSVALCTAGALYLIEVWDLFGSTVPLWRRFLGLTIGSGEHAVTVAQTLVALFSIYVAVVVSRTLRAYLDEESPLRRHLDAGVRDSLKRLLHYAVLVVGVYVALAFLGFDLRNLTLLAGALGVGIGFGLQNIVNNFISGLILLFERPVRPGDLVVIGGQEGIVKAIGLRSTVLETFESSEVIVPNSELIAQRVTNWTLSNTQTRIAIPVGVAYGSDLEKVLRVLEETARAHPGAMKEPRPTAVFGGFGDSSIDFEVRLWVDSLDKRLTVRGEVALALAQRLRAEGIEIPFPQRDLHLRSVAADAAALFSPDSKDSPRTS